MRQALCTISWVLLTSEVCTQWAPHSSEKRRAVARSSVSSMIGTAGRSRAARSAVDPDMV